MTETLDVRCRGVLARFLQPDAIHRVVRFRGFVLVSQIGGAHGIASGGLPFKN
jgi:hypothetical protein